MPWAVELSVGIVLDVKGGQGRQEDEAAMMDGVGDKQGKGQRLPSYLQSHCPHLRSSALLPPFAFVSSTKVPCLRTLDSAYSTLSHAALPLPFLLPLPPRPLLRC